MGMKSAKALLWGIMDKVQQVRACISKAIPSIRLPSFSRLFGLHVFLECHMH
jgi:hypothetical protein